MSTLEIYEFEIQLVGYEVDDDLAESVLGAGCDDALLWSRDGEIFLSFHREAFSMSQAVRSALDDLEEADVEVKKVTEPYLAEDRVAAN